MLQINSAHIRGNTVNLTYTISLQHGQFENERNMSQNVKIGTSADVMLVETLSFLNCSGIYVGSTVKTKR